MATSIITSTIRQIDDYALSVNGDYLSNRTFLLGHLTAAVKSVLGSVPSRPLLDASGGLYDADTTEVSLSSASVLGGVRRIVLSIKADHLCDISAEKNGDVAVYDERVVNKVSRRVAGHAAIALAEMAGSRFPNTLRADVHLLVATTDEQHATVVVEITDKGGKGVQR
jgi:hypothetical protein